MIFAQEQYAKGGYFIPDRESRKEDKDSAEYARKVAEYVYSEMCSGKTYITHDLYTSVRRNRDYARGQQDRGIYEDAFYGRDANNNTLETVFERNGRKINRKAYANLNFEIQSPMPRVMDSITNKIIELVERVSVDATDSYSGAERESAKWGAYVDGKFKEEFRTLRALSALPQQEPGYVPRSIEELNLYEAEGGFKLAYEETMERLLKFSFEQSGFEENSLERYVKDCVENGFACSVDTYDKSSGLVKQRYVDIQYAGVQYTREDANQNPDFGFYIDMVKLSELRHKGIDEEKLNDLAKTYTNFFGNGSSDDLNKQNKTSQKDYYSNLDKFIVPVFVVYWKDVEFKNEKQYKNRQGKTRTKDVDSKYKAKKNEKMLETRIKTIREVHWVISSDVVYDYGKTEFQARDGFKEPVLPIHMVQVSGRPIVPRLIPSLDQYMNAWMRLQQGISMAAMDGYAIEMDAISNLNLGGKKMSPREVLRFWRQTGTLFYKKTDMAGRPNMSQSKPIEQLKGGAGAVIIESMQLMDLAMRQIEELTGINPVSMGATPTPEQGKAVTEYSLIGTNDILKGVLRKVNILKSNVARAMCLRLQHVIDVDKRAYNAYKDVVGETSLEVVKIANGHDVKYGIRTHARPTQEDRRSIEEMLQVSLKNGRDGKDGITEADYIRFHSMLASGVSYKRIALMLDFANKKAKEEAEARRLAAMKQEQQGTQITNQQKAQQAQQEKLMETQSSIAIENVKGRNNILDKAVGAGTMSPEQALAMIYGQSQGQPQQPAPQPEQQEGAPAVGEEQRVLPAGEEAPA